MNANPASVNAPSSIRVVYLVLGLATYGLFVAMAVVYASYEKELQKSDLVGIPNVSGEYVISNPDKDVGSDAQEAMAYYGQVHQDRRVASAQLVVVIDAEGRAKLYHKIFYKPR